MAKPDDSFLNPRLGLWLHEINGLNMSQRMLLKGNAPENAYCVQLLVAFWFGGCRLLEFLFFFFEKVVLP